MNRQVKCHSERSEESRHSCPLPTIYCLLFLTLFTFTSLGLPFAPAFAQTPIQCGQVISGSITDPLKWDFYTFTANTNDVVNITLSHGNFNVFCFRLIDSVGNIIQDWLCSDKNDIVGDIVWENALPPSPGGTYTIVVKGEIRSYNLAWHRRNTPCTTSTPIACGQPISGSITDTDPLKWDFYTFTANTNDVVNITLSHGNFNVFCFRLIDSVGNIIQDWLCSDKNDIVGDIVWENALPPSPGGTYTIVVKGSVRDYNLAWHRVNGPCPTTPTTTTTTTTSTTRTTTTTTTTRTSTSTTTTTTTRRTTTTTSTTTTTCPLVTLCRDADVDGYGNPNDTKQACVNNAPTGYVSDCSDCNDADPTVNPGAFEICGDFKDNDCDGLVDCDCADTTYSRGTSYIRFNHRRASRDTALIRLCVNESFCNALRAGPEEIILTLGGCQPVHIPDTELMSNSSKTRFWARSSTYALTIDCTQGWLIFSLKNKDLKVCVSNPVNTCVFIEGGPCICAEKVFVERKDKIGRPISLTLNVTEACSP